MNSLLSVPAPLRAYLANVERRWQGSVAQRVWQLWLAELRSCVPVRLRHRFSAQVPVQTHRWPITMPGPEVQAGARQVLMLPTPLVTIHHLQLPTAAARDLTAVVGYELDKYTPYPRDQLLYVVRQGGRSAGWLQVTLIAILRERLNAILAECGAHGLTPQRVDVCAEDGTPLGIDLLPDAARPLNPRAGIDRRRVLAGSCAVLLITLMGLWLHDRQQRLQGMRATVQAQKAEVAQVQQLRQQLTNTLGAADYLSRHKAARPTMAALMSELTACLPDDTWLEQLEIDADDVSFSGQSVRASALISRLKDCRSLENPQFQGVIQPDAASGKERFALHARLHQEAADGPNTDTP
ncbi:PilN domain-containing protein [Pseudomonas sp. Ps21-P2]|uniref:PilN domain-containing protein n=1 Tax=Pseudomonas sp. Ps21-P2 TaxID=3080331 RepID=UPI003207CCE0